MENQDIYTGSFSRIQSHGPDDTIKLGKPGRGQRFEVDKGISITGRLEQSGSHLFKLEGVIPPDSKTKSYTAFKLSVEDQTGLRSNGTLLKIDINGQTILEVDASGMVSLVGPISMRGGNITGLADPERGSDPVTLKFMEAILRKILGDADSYDMVALRDGSRDHTADQSAGGYRITDLSDPKDQRDAAPARWVENKIATSLAIRPRDGSALADLTCSMLEQNKLKIAGHRPNLLFEFLGINGKTALLPFPDEGLICSPERVDIAPDLSLLVRLVADNDGPVYAIAYREEAGQLAPSHIDWLGPVVGIISFDENKKAIDFRDGNGWVIYPGTGYGIEIVKLFPGEVGFWLDLGRFIPPMASAGLLRASGDCEHLKIMATEVGPTLLEGAEGQVSVPLINSLKKAAYVQWAGGGEATISLYGYRKA